MKKIAVFLAFIAFASVSFAQSRGTFGTIQTFTQQPVALYSVSVGVLTPITVVDTFTIDTTVGQFTFNGNYDIGVDVAITKISGTVGGTLLLQGSYDNSTWYAITGNTTYCASCIGASATITNTAGTKHYVWDVPHSAVNFKYYQVTAIPTGTMSATFNPNVYYKY
jgi:hypothetical protein